MTKPTDAMIEAGFQVLWRTEFKGLTDDPQRYKDAAVAIYTAMHEARPQSAAHSPDADLVERFAALIELAEARPEPPKNNCAKTITISLYSARQILKTLQSKITTRRYDTEELVQAFRALPLNGDAGCDKLTDEEWNTVATVAIEALTATAPHSNA